MTEVALKFKKHYDLGLWTKEILIKALNKKYITQAEFDEMIKTK